MSTGAFHLGSRRRPDSAESAPHTLDEDRAVAPEGAPETIAAADAPSGAFADFQPLPSPLPPLAPPHEEAFATAEAPRRAAWGEIVPAALIGLVAVAWIATVVAALARDGGAPNDLLRVATWIGVGSAPIALLGILWLAIAHGGRGEGRRYARTARAMRLDSQNLVNVLGILTRRLEDGRTLMETQGHQLDQLGRGAAERFIDASEAIRRESADFKRLTELLEGSGSVARGDIQTLIGELPAAEEHARRIAQTLRTAGITAHDQVEGLAKQLAAIGESAHMADMQVNVSAERLTAQLGHITSTGTQTVRRIEDVTHGLDRMIGQSLETAGQAIDATRTGIAAQADALSAIAEQARTALDRAGSDQAAQLGRRLDEINGRIEAFVGRLAGQDAASLGLVTNLETALDRIEARFGTLGSSGAEKTADLAETLVALAAHVEHVAHALGGGTVAAGTLLDRVTTVRRVLDSNARDLEDTIPASLSRLRLHAERSLAVVASATPQAETLAALTESTATKLSEMAGAVETQGRAVESMGAGVDSRLSAVRDQAIALNRLIVETGHNAESLASGTAGRLTDAMQRVRETAVQAADQTRTALAALVPDLADELARAMEETVDRVLADRTRAHLAGMKSAASEAIETTEGAADRLARHIERVGEQAGAIEHQVAKQIAAVTAAADAMEDRVTQHLATVNEAADAMEARVSDARETTDRQDNQAFSRQVALLVESLNSSAIDVAKILSNDITDTAWAAYLRGDRGVFTRRAVRLLDSTETRELLKLYAAEPEFREQVNRYIHDFEAMLRRVLSSRDGGPLGVTMLSSDMGKLYVALAQAIERLRG